MKKLLIIILALTLCLALTSCDPIEQIKNWLNPQTPVEYNLDNAATYLKNLYKDQNPVTASDYEVVGQVMIKGVKYDVTWESSNDKITIDPSSDPNSPHYIVNVDERSETAEEYTLTATITAGNGETKQVVFEGRSVPEYAVLSFEEYMAAQEGDIVTIEGIVTAINAESLGNKRNHIFLVDASGNGGYYSYQMPEDPAVAGIEVGMTVSISGEISPYSGMQEIKGGTATIVDSNKQEVLPVDLTEVFTNATSETSFANYVGMLVTLKGVELGSQDLSTSSSQYLYFTIGNVKSYVRTYVTDMIGGASAAEKEANKAAIDKLHADSFGYTADVTGIVVLYSGNPYFIPVDAEPFTNVTFVEKTPAEKIEAEKDGLSIAEKVTAETVLTLPALGQYYNDVTITWTLDGAAVEGSVTLTPTEEPKDVVLVATFVCGEVTETKEYKITLSMAPISIPEVLESADGTPVIVEGIVSEINTVWSEQYNNITVTIRDGEGNTLYVYRTTTNVQVGDAVKITGVVGSYNGAKQIAQGSTAVITGHYTEMTLPEATAAEDGTLVIVTGTVVEADTWSEQYGNMSVTIEDAEGNTLYVYRLGTKVEIGDKIVVTGKVGSYKGSKQIAQGGKAMPAPEEVVVPEISISDALAAADGTEVVVSGTVVSASTWSEQYGNMSVTIEDEAGNQLYVFRVSTKLAVGDVITVTGTMDTYNDERQIAQGAKVVIKTSHDHDYADATCGAPKTCKLCGNTDGAPVGEHTWEDATCTAPKTCSVCNATEGAALAHTYENGVCTGCGVTDPSVASTTTVTKTMAELATANSWTTGTQYKDTAIALDSVISVTFSGGSNSGKFYDGDHIRVYATDTPAGTITITAADNRTIVSVKITTVEGTYAFLQLAGDNTEDYSNQLVSVNASSITFNSVKNGSNGKQVRVLSIEVIYQ